MKGTIFLILFVTLALTASCAVAGPSFVLSGHVYGGTGTSNPLSGATVNIGPAPITVTTNSSGAYSLNSPPTGSVQITASAWGYDPQTVTKTINIGVSVIQDFNLVATAHGLPVSIPMDHQINIGLGNAITGPGSLTFQAADPGAGEPDGWCKNPIPGGVDGPRIDLTKAGLAPLDISDPSTVMDVDVRIYHEQNYGDAGMVLMLQDTSGRWRNYGYNTPGGLNSYLRDNNWSHRTYVLNNYAMQAWDLGGSDPNFDTTHVNYITWSASDWQNLGNDWTGAKKITIRIAPPPPSIGVIKALPLHSSVQLWVTPVSYTATLAGAPANKYFYLQQADRSAGIRAVNLSSSAMPAAGGYVTFTGTLENDASTQEPYLAITSLSASGSGNSIPPLGVTTRTICGDTKLVGQLIRTSGTIRAIDTAAYQWFTISDGYTKNGAEVTTKVALGTIAGDPVLDNKIMVGNFVELTGVVSQTDSSTKVILLKSFKVLAGPTSPPQRAKFKAIVVNCNPHCGPAYGNKRTNEVFGWADPHYLCQTYLDDLREASGGFADYDVVDWIDCEYHTIFEGDGYQYPPDEYPAAWQNHGTVPMHTGGMDYPRFLTDKVYPHNNPRSLAERVAAGECDEILLFGAPGADGRWEASMSGPSPYFVNGGTYYVPQTGKNVIIMGFNYERGVGEMLEDFLHRSENILSRAYGGWHSYPPQQNWDKFSLLDKNIVNHNTYTAGVGNCHFAPNSVGDYDWGNATYVWSTCDDWVLNWPNLQGNSTKRWVNCTEWGNGDIRLHHVWWLRHIPKRPGTMSGKQNNWWKYLCDYWAYPESR